MGHALKVAVADDDRDTREYIQELLSRLGHLVVAAEGGRRLVELCREFRPDVVVTDHGMPDMDGLAAAAEINRERRVPVILVSGQDPAELLPSANGCVVAFLIKPVRRGDLEAAITRAVPRPREATV
jgi:CheY-like chemotaxis protein